MLVLPLPNPMGVFSVIIYFVIFCFQCQITSFSEFWFLLLVVKHGAEHVGVFAVHGSGACGLVLLNTWGLAMSCKHLFSFSASLLPTFLLTTYFLSSHHWMLMCLFSVRWVFFFFNSLNLFLAFVLPSEYYFRDCSSYSRCSIFYCASDATVI